MLEHLFSLTVLKDFRRKMKTAWVSLWFHVYPWCSIELCRHNKQIAVGCLVYYNNRRSGNRIQKDGQKSA